jgi:hypothetical protein
LGLESGGRSPESPDGIGECIADAIIGYRRDGGRWDTGNGATESGIGIITDDGNASPRREWFWNQVSVVAEESAGHAAVRVDTSRPVGERETRFVEGEGLGPIVGFGEWIVEQYGV